jgi:hypothetical protein
MNVGEDGADGFLFGFGKCWAVRQSRLTSGWKKTSRRSAANAVSITCEWS